MKRIKAAAIKHNHGFYNWAVYWVDPPGRHSDVIEFMRSLGTYDFNDEQIIMGFITDDLQFVDRKKAAKIAYKAGQINRKLDGLLSENLW